MLDRRAVVQQLLTAHDGGVVVSGLGGTTWDVAACGDSERYFYLWGAMGCAAVVGLGLALARPDERVMVVTGDGEMLMGMGSLASVALQRPGNLTIAVIDNEHYGETGGQPSHTGAGVDLAAAAAAAGIKRACAVRDADELTTFCTTMTEHHEPQFVVIKVSPAQPSMVLPSRDGHYLKNRFRHALGAKAS